VADAVASITAALAALDPARSGGPQPLLVVAGASNVTGEFWPLERLVAVARRHGARVVVDAAQLLAHRPLDLAALGADWVAFSGHKLHAPYGTGALVGRRDWLETADPYLPGGGASAAVTDAGTRWATGAARHEGGSPNVLGAVALAAACATLTRHREAIARHESALTARLLDGLRALPGVRTYSLLGDDADRGPVVTFTVDGLDSHLVAVALSAEHGIGVRAGKFCAHPAVDALLARAATPGEPAATTAVRVSAGLATTPEHVERLLAAVRALAATGPAVPYRRDPEHGWLPVEDGRDLAVAPLW
jgi:selenocysteine lyase/cysteine desulfurase